MNSERMNEVRVQQRAVNKILENWTKDMREDHYYSLRITLIAIVSYVMDNTDNKPEVNPLVEVYSK